MGNMVGDVKDVEERGAISKEDRNLTTSNVTVQWWHRFYEYKYVLLWSAFMGLAGVNWGLDVMLSTGTIAVPAFERDFGMLFLGDYIIGARWQVAFNTASSAGGLLGAIATGQISDAIGRKWTMCIACVTSIGSVFIQFFANKSEVLIVGKLINGLCLGCFISLPAAYASEISPVTLRGLTTSSMQLYLGIGQLLGNIILQQTGSLDSAYAYKIPFALQFVFPVFLLIGLPFCPESPWYLIRNNKPLEAKNSLQKLGYQSPTDTLLEMIRTIQHEDAESAKATYLDCFRGSDLRRTEIATGIIAIAQLTGVIFVVGYSTYFFQLAGISTSTSFTLSVGVSILGLLGVMGSWCLINRFGRRSLTLFGISILTSLLLLIGILDVIPTKNTTTTKIPLYMQVTFIILFAFIYLLTIGPTSYALLSEISSTRLRSTTVSLGIVTQSVFGIVLNIVIPLMISPDAANLKGKVGFVFGATAAMGCVWVWFRVPETRGRGFRELDTLFEIGVDARRFKDYGVA